MRRRVKPGTRPMLDHCGPTGKVRYTSEAAALQALTHLQRIRVEDEDERRRESRAYKCWNCLGYHLSSKALA